MKAGEIAKVVAEGALRLCGHVDGFETSRSLVGEAGKRPLVLLLFGGDQRLFIMIRLFNDLSVCAFKFNIQNGKKLLDKS